MAGKPAAGRLVVELGEGRRPGMCSRFGRCGCHLRPGFGRRYGSVGPRWIVLFGRFWPRLLLLSTRCAPVIALDGIRFPCWIGTEWLISLPVLRGMLVVSRGSVIHKRGVVKTKIGGV